MTDPVPIRDAATVVLLRDGAAGVDVWLLTRVDQMVFAAGITVFPGGRVDAADSELPWSGRSPDGLALRLGCDALVARALVGAAVRETFEETGVLLTDPPSGVLDVGTLAADVEAGRIQFGDLLRDRGLVGGARSLASMGAVDHPGRRGAALRHQVLRGRPAGRGHAGRSHERVVDRRVVPGASRFSRGRARRADAHAADACCPAVRRRLPYGQRGVGGCGCARPDAGGPGPSSGCRWACASSSRMAPWCRCPGGPGDQRTAVRAAPVGDALGCCGARRQSRTDDAGRHQHLGAARARIRRRNRRRSGPGRRQPISRRSRRARLESTRSCSPTGTSITARARPRCTS